MATHERSRHQMYLKLEEVLGSEEADTLMNHLPPTGWADVARKSDLDQLAVATKRDLENLGLRLESKMESMESRFEAKLEAGLRSQLITTLTIMSSLFVVLAGLTFATARLV
jgi:hypothetical protein